MFEIKDNKIRFSSIYLPKFIHYLIKTDKIKVKGSNLLSSFNDIESRLTAGQIFFKLFNLCFVDDSQDFMLRTVKQQIVCDRRHLA